MLRRKLFAPVSAHKSERHTARNECIGDAADWLAAEIGVKQGAVDVLALQCGKRIANGRQRSDHHEPTLLQRPGYIEGDEKLVLHHQDALGCAHSLRPSRFFRSASLSFPPERFSEFG
jgi:hypothetical protein